MNRVRALLAALTATAGPALGAGGPLGIDHQLNMHDSGIWKRSAQTAVLGLTVTATVAAAFWECGETRLGKTLWQSIDSGTLATAGAAAGKLVFSRERPSETSDPNKWFQSGRHYSFPSGEVSAMAGIVTPIVLEYGHDYPAVYALELLPAYSAIARLRVRAHWQTDVLAGWALGTATGYYAHSRDSPFILSALPTGVSVGFRKRW